MLVEGRKCQAISCKFKNETAIFTGDCQDAPPFCHPFIGSLGGNFTCVWLSSLCYCILCIIVPSTCCHSHWSRERKDRVGNKAISKLTKNLWELPCLHLHLLLPLSSFISFNHTSRGGKEKDCISSVIKGKLICTDIKFYLKKELHPTNQSTLLCYKTENELFPLMRLTVFLKSEYFWTLFNLLSPRASGDHSSLTSVDVISCREKLGFDLMNQNLAHILLIYVLSDKQCITSCQGLNCLFPCVHPLPHKSVSPFL